MLLKSWYLSAITRLTQVSFVSKRFYNHRIGSWLAWANNTAVHWECGHLLPASANKYRPAVCS